MTAQLRVLLASLGDTLVSNSICHSPPWDPLQHRNWHPLALQPFLLSLQQPPQVLLTIICPPGTTAVEEQHSHHQSQCQQQPQQSKVPTGDWERGIKGGVCPFPLPPEPPLGFPLTIGTEQLLPSKMHIRAPHLGKGLG